MFSQNGSFKVVTKNRSQLQILDVIVNGSGVEYMKMEIEHIGARGGMAFTITFTDTNLYKYNKRYLMNEVGRILKTTKGVQSFAFISDLSSTGRFHLHGAVRFKHVRNVNTLRRKLSKFGITKVKTIDNTVRWAEYCTEQYSEVGKKGIKLTYDDKYTING